MRGRVSTGVSSSNISVTWQRRCPAERREPDRGNPPGLANESPAQFVPQGTSGHWRQKRKRAL